MLPAHGLRIEVQSNNLRLVVETDHSENLALVVSPNKARAIAADLVRGAADAEGLDTQSD